MSEVTLEGIREKRQGILDAQGQYKQIMDTGNGMLAKLSPEQRQLLIRLKDEIKGGKIEIVKMVMDCDDFYQTGFCDTCKRRYLLDNLSIVHDGENDWSVCGHCELVNMP